MPKIKKDELDRVYNSLYKPKQRVLPANKKIPKRIDYVSDLKTNKQIIYFIDGYNLMYSIEEINDIARNDLISARDKVIDIVSDYQGYIGQPCVLVFDAYKNNISIPIINRKYNIEIVYTKMNQTADSYIEQKTKELANNYKMFVVTSDNLEQLKILSNNAYRISCAEFMHRYHNLQKKYKNNTKLAKHQPMKELRKLLFEEEE